LDAEFLRRRFPRSRLFGTAPLFTPGGAPKKVEAVSGACMMVRRQVFDLVGGFSDDYFMYGEDLDLCFRVSRAGFSNYHVSDAIVVHHGGGSTRQTVSRFSVVMTAESTNRFLQMARGRLHGQLHRVLLSGAAVARLAALCLLFPARSAIMANGGWAAALHRWAFVLRWGIGLERWTRQYDRLGQAAAVANHTGR
jgi:GT2 family glycosyltransferase